MTTKKYYIEVVGILDSMKNSHLQSDIFLSNPIIEMWIRKRFQIWKNIFSRISLHNWYSFIFYMWE